MASHFSTIRPRSLANILADLQEARRDWEQAMDDAYASAAQLNEPESAAEIEAADRMSEADTRLEDLRDEFASRFLEATGLTWQQFKRAVDGGLL